MQICAKRLHILYCRYVPLRERCIENKNKHDLWNAFICKIVNNIRLEYYEYVLVNESSSFDFNFKRRYFVIK